MNYAFINVIFYHISIPPRSQFIYLGLQLMVILLLLFLSKNVTKNASFFSSAPIINPLIKPAV